MCIEVGYGIARGGGKQNIIGGKAPLGAVAIGIITVYGQRGGEDRLY